MRRDSSLFDLTTLIFTPLFLVFTCLSAAGCGTSESGTSLPRHVFQGQGCAGEVAGTALASFETSDATAIRSYDYRFDGEGLHLRLLGDGGEELGVVRSELIIERLQPARWTVETWLVRGGEEVARQTLRGHALGEGRIQLEAINRAGEMEARSWATLDGEFDLERTSLGAPAQGAGAGVVASPDGSFDLLRTSQQGEALDEEEVEDWMEERGLDAFAADENWNLLRFAANDTAWLDAADLELRRCRAFDDSTGFAPVGDGGSGKGASVEREEGLGSQTHGLCTIDSTSAGLGVIGQGLCDERKNPMEGVFAAEGVLSAFGAGILITGSLVAAGVVSSGLAIGAVLIGSSVAAWYVGNRIEKWLNDNKRTVIDGATWVGGGLKDRNRSDNTEVVDFVGGSSGDPHLDTFDGLGYDLQSAGEFVLVRSSDDEGFEVQVRQEPISGICSGVSINTAVAARIGGDRIFIEAGNAAGLRLNGDPIGLPGGALALDGGSVEEKAGGFLLRWVDGSSMRVGGIGAGRTDVRLGLAQGRRGAVEGLLGNFNGDRSDDLVMADGTLLGSPLRWDDLVGPFSDSWRVDASTSLFDYAEGEDTATYRIDGFPSRPNTVDDLPAEVREEARMTCVAGGIEEPAVIEACTLDVGCTGDASLVDAHLDRAPDELADVSRPIFLDGWAQAGRSNYGTWVVSEDGRSVQQSVNGDPTFFVSDRDYFNTRIRGTFEVNASDDDFIGFVFGFKSPIPENDDPLDQYDAFFLSWKGRNQTDGGYVAPAGFTLYHLDREVVSGDVQEIFWGVQEAEGREIIATAHARDRGWVRGEVYEFELVYSADRIEIAIDGEEIFSVGQEESGAPFIPGRFGFYNYSQPGVTYGNFEVTEVN